MHTFNARLPKSTTYRKENDIFFIKHTSFLITIDEARAVGELLKEAHKDKGTKAIVIDNREAKGAWTQEVNRIWMEVSATVSNEIPKKVVTLTGDVIGAMQINRLSKNGGTENVSRAFCSDFNDEVAVFINT